MDYHKRQLETYFLHEAAYYPVTLVTGARQVGKSTMLLHLKEEGRRYVSLDDPAARNLAQYAPELFLAQYQPPLIINEIQYAPQLFPYIKMQVDQTGANNLFWLTGSQTFPLMQGVQESLAGRVRILQLSGFSRKEAAGQDQAPFPRDLTAMLGEEVSDLSLEETVLRGTMPRVLFQEGIDIAGYYQSYLDTYVSRDVREISNVLDTDLFLRFVTLLATRTGQELNLAGLGRELGIDSSTVRRWLNILQTCALVFELPAYSGNLGKRLTKRPKIYFQDPGLAAYLSGIRDIEGWQRSPIRGALFENWVVAEIEKSYRHNGLEPRMYYYRDSNQKEIDLLLEANGKLYPCEIKGAAEPQHAAKNFSVLAALDDQIPFYSILCPTPAMTPLNERVWRIPVSLI